MFTDMKEALEAESLDLIPPGTDQSTAASVAVARHARGKDDLADLLRALGLPCAEDDLVRLLPHLTSPVTTTGDPMPANAFTATAASMLTNGDSPEYVRSTLGLSESEIAEAAQHASAPAPTPAGEGANSPVAPAPEGAVSPGGIEALLSWAEAHPAASVRNRAARVRSALADLTERHAIDAAQQAARDRVAHAKAELEAAQEQLREVKADSRATPALQVAPQASSPVASGKRSKEELAAIRTWARANGHQVADRGTPSRSVLDAYDAAHRVADLAEAS
ncbi:histone-like nucleoid-structuring protein Lsr2 [Streptomyces diacarni]|uniref:Lsr2 family DNA-binding protein n=1 Tax=Streptomyces diacarni TaxID=2800381 RepID=UPI0033C624FC